MFSDKLGLHGMFNFVNYVQMYNDELGLHMELTRDVRDHKMRTAAIGTPAKAATRGNFEVSNSGIS